MARREGHGCIHRSCGLSGSMSGHGQRSRPCLWRGLRRSRMRRWRAFASTELGTRRTCGNASSANCTSGSRRCQPGTRGSHMTRSASGRKSSDPCTPPLDSFDNEVGNTLPARARVRILPMSIFPYLASGALRHPLRPQSAWHADSACCNNRGSRRYARKR